MAAELVAFNTTDLSRRSRFVIDYAREHRRTGALVRDGDGTLLRVALAAELVELDEMRRYADMLVPLAVRGVDGDSATDYPGLGWLPAFAPEHRRTFLGGALERFVLGVDTGDFGELRTWIDEWRHEADLERAGILERLRNQTSGDAAVADRPRLRR